MTKEMPFKTRFPLLDKLVLDGVTNRGKPILSYDPKLFDIDNVQAYIFNTIVEGTQTDGDSRLERSGPLRLPYKTMWAEFMLRHGKGNPDPMGVLCEEYEPGEEFRQTFFNRVGGSDLHPQAHLILMSLYDKTALFNGSNWLIWATKNGVFVGEASAQNQAENSLHIHAKNNNEQVRKAMWQLVAPVVTAIGLTNCRNITVEDHTTKPTTKRRHRKRIPVPGTEYKVIKLPGAPSNRVDGEVKNEGTTRYHTVRGHFKTYTAEKPLYGKLTGTWWWAPSVRGNRDHGEIISTYEQHQK